MKKLLLLIFINTCCYFIKNKSLAQSVNYNDVVVIINVNDTMSVNIGNYFMLKRNIPLNNLIKINVTNKEKITPAEWTLLKSQIEDSISAKQLNFNYLVTTKGVPLKINYGGSLMQPDSRNASVDSELMLIGTPNANFIGGAGLVLHSYFNKDTYFNSSVYGFYLVTRLTGYTQADVFKLIDNSGPQTYVDKNSVKFVLDAIVSGANVTTQHNTELINAHNYLIANGWNDTLNNANTYTRNQTDVIGYWSWGSNETSAGGGSSAPPGNTWSKASIAETAVSTSARSFTPGTNYGQSLIADWIKEGVTGISGCVYEPTLGGVSYPSILFSRYVNSKAYNLAESFYMASATTSWMQVVVGDPKTSIVTTMAPVVELNDDTKVNVYPNPNKGIFQMDITLRFAKDVTVSVTNILGQQVFSEFLSESNVYNQTIDLSRFEKGIYLLILTTKEKKISKKIIVE